MSRLDVRLKERDEARKAAIAARRLEKEEKSKPEETASYFREKFTSQKAGRRGQGHDVVFNSRSIAERFITFLGTILAHSVSPRSSIFCCGF